MCGRVHIRNALVKKIALERVDSRVARARAWEVGFPGSIPALSEEEISERLDLSLDCMRGILSTPCYHRFMREQEVWPHREEGPLSPCLAMRGRMYSSSENKQNCLPVALVNR